MSVYDVAATGKGDGLRSSMRKATRAVEKAVGYKGSVRFFGETVCDLLRGALQYDRMSTQLLPQEASCS